MISVPSKTQKPESKKEPQKFYYYYNILMILKCPCYCSECLDLAILLLENKGLLAKLVFIDLNTTFREKQSHTQVQIRVGQTRP